MNKWIMLGAAIVSEVAGSLSLKSALDHPLWYSVVVVGYTGAFVFIFRAMKEGMGLGVAYGIWGALGVALTAIFGAVLFGEPLTGLMAVGLTMIIGGVLVVELGSQRAQKHQQMTEGAAS
ncbi:DMT family transporter [Rhodococcus wratislaviensis]|uniref:DMT family transporter n=1 Tax=Rhodococcus wratislaviensis TaxID=44752 RepID=UPI0036673677